MIQHFVLVTNLQLTEFAVVNYLLKYKIFIFVDGKLKEIVGYKEI
jgi:hypothetical protein